VVLYAFSVKKSGAWLSEVGGEGSRTTTFIGDFWNQGSFEIG